MIKNLPATQETQVQSLGWEDPLEKGMTFKDVNMRLCVQSCRLVYTSGVQCLLRASSPSGCAFVDFTVLCRVQQHSIFTSRTEANIKGRVMQLVLPRNASCSTVQLYFSKYCTARLKMIFCICLLCIICVKSIINLLQYSTIQPIVLVRYLG